MRFRKNPADILKEIGIYQPEDIDLELVAFHLNAEVRYSPLSNYEGQIIGTDSHAIITLDDRGHPLRQKFSLGHEIGHWVNDRGRNLTYRCTTEDMRRRWSKDRNNPRQQVEARANAFSAQLMMPDHILPDYQNGLDVTAESISHLASIFNVSKTSMAIRFIETNELPCILICWSKSGTRKWFTRNPIVPDSIWPHKSLLNPSTTLSDSNGVEVDADKWIDGESSEDYSVVESVFSNTYDQFSVVWWKDESQLSLY